VPCRAAIFFTVLCAGGGAAQVVDSPCVPRFRADPSYIHTAEATGGQMLLLDRKEIAQPAITKAQLGFNDQTFLRASGTLGSGFVELTAPVDSTVKSLQFTVFAECVKTIEVTSPSGAAVEGAKLSSGRIIQLDAPEPGLWRVKLAGTGYFSAIAQGKSGIGLIVLHVDAQSLTARMNGSIASAEFRILARNGATLQTIPMTQDGPDFKGAFTPPTQPYRIAAEGQDDQGRPFRRVHAPLLDAKP
jgi:hypothetical protein